MISTFSAPRWHVVPGPKFGQSLAERREFKQFKTQSELARAVRKLAQDGALPDDLRPFSQQWLSALEDDRTGHVIAGARPRMIRALAYMLGWSAVEFEENVGVSIGTVPNFPNPTPLDTSPPPPPRRLRALPSELEDMIREKRALAPELGEERWQQYLAGQRFSTGSATPERWWNLFLLLRNAGVEPGGN